MSTNSSSGSSALLNPCLGARTGLFVFTAFCVTNILLVPLFLLVLHMGFQRWRRRRSGSTATPTSHSDFFTYNVAVLELIGFLGCCFYCCGAFKRLKGLVQVAQGLFYFSSAGQSLFHVLTCVERHLAVVHPITYLSLRRSSGVRIRNVSTAGVWLLCFMALVQSKVIPGSALVVTQSTAMVFLICVVSCCSVSVLWVLIRPRPGTGGRDRAGVDQSKQRAVHTVTAITAALWLRFVGVLLGSLMSDPRLSEKCVLNSYAAFLTLPGSLVLPLLFLHRAGKLPGSHRGAEAPPEEASP